MADGIFTKNGTAKARKANECIVGVKHLKPPENLFDEFWREGELALLFGPSGTGKSVLAVQVAEAIARGRKIEGFTMTAKRQKVLYVDLNFSEKQFGWRYTNEGKQYKLSENLYRERPAADEKLIDWLRSKVTETGFRVIVIDDLSAVRQTCDGTRETLKLMRELKQLKDELDMSVLVLSGSHEQRRGEFISEACLKRSAVLCDVADSVFAIGTHPRAPRYHCMIQTRVRSAAVKWHSGNAPVCSVHRSEDAFLGMIFDERFTAEIDGETRQLICNIKWRRDAKASYSSIAEEFDISKTTAFRLFRKWTPALEKDIVIEPLAAAEDFNADQADGADNADGSNWIDPVDPPSFAFNDHTGNRGFYPKDISKIPFMAALKRIHITELKRGVDGYGREIFIQEEQHHDGKPIVWYQYDSKGKIIRKDRDSWGIKITHPDTPWISSVDFVTNGCKGPHVSKGDTHNPA